MTVALSMPISSATTVNDLLTRICVRLQLTPTQYADAVAHYTAVGKWLSAPDSPLAQFYPQIFPQGSLRIGTTVRPFGRDEYDLDLVCQLILFGTWNPLASLDLVERRLRAHGIYGPMVERKNRCVRLNFAKQFHLDILPARPDQTLGGTYLRIPDRKLVEWKPSNPKGYAGWFEQQSLMRCIAMTKAIEPLPAPEGAEEKTPLQLATQLFKRWRDIRYDDPELAPISIVLTTLAGTHYRGEAHPLEALLGIVTGIETAIPASGRLYVCNPAHPAEDLSERWDTNPAAYRAFVGGIRDLARKLTVAPSLEGLPRLREFLEDLFGDVASTAIRDHATAIERIRTSGRLSVIASSGVLTSSAAERVVPVRPNTFYD
jgi:hypothetical protein